MDTDNSKNTLYKLQKMYTSELHKNIEHIYSDNDNDNDSVLIASIPLSLNWIKNLNHITYNTLIN